MPELRQVHILSDTISVGAVSRDWQARGVGPVSFRIRVAMSGFEFATQLELAQAEDLHDKLGQAIDESKREVSGE